MKATPPSKYRQVFEALQRDIAAGIYKAGEKLPSEANLVQRFGASRITVGRAVKELQLRDLVDRRAGSGTYVKTRSTGLVFGLLIPDLARSEIFEPICQGLADAPATSSHMLLWGRGTMAEPMEDRRKIALQLCQQFIDRQVNGVFFAPLETAGPEDRTNTRIIEALNKARIPVVLIDRDHTPYPTRSGHDLVGIDNRRTGHRATAHLLQLGARKVGFVTYATPVATIHERIAGYREALYSAGLASADFHIVTLPSETPEEIGAKLQPLNLDGIVCANDPTAGHVMRGLATVGLRVPQDIRVIGIDDVRYAALLPVPLSTMHQPCREIGAAAMSAMLERLAWPAMPARDILLECRLVIRESCGATNA